MNISKCEIGKFEPNCIHFSKGYLIFRPGFGSSHLISATDDSVTPHSNFLAKYPPLSPLDNCFRRACDSANLLLVHAADPDYLTPMLTPTSTMFGNQAERPFTFTGFKIVG